MTIEQSKLERIQAIASIASSIALPLMLAVIGYLLQRQIADEGLKKDYVSIAAGILKEDPGKQEPDLRKWAVLVLDTNSPIPFSNKAKDGLLKGSPLVMAGPPLLQPISDCMQPPKRRTVLKEAAELVRKLEQDPDSESARESMSKFIDVVMKEERAALKNISNLECMQFWGRNVVELDNSWRTAVGAEDSKTTFEKLHKEIKGQSKNLTLSNRPK